MAGIIIVQGTAFATTINGAAALIFLVISLLIVLHSLRCIYGRCLQRRYMVSGISHSDQQDPQLFIAIGDPQNPSIEPPKTGLSPSVIAALPTFVYKKHDQTDGTGDTMECSICLSTIEEEETVRLLPNCSHVFHVQCIDMWLSSQTTCPICRTVAQPQTPSVPDQQETEKETHLQVLDPDEETTTIVPPLEPLNSVIPSSEAASGDTSQSSKVDASSSRPSSFRKILSWTRSGRKFQQLELSAVDHGVEDP
ncbi:RING-H2 finger protein ATL40-like [Telopea speciosissima]|uniref:RING-H2 finger protein ATL40-like n=1 Tax=Telopea speciosissima TaxID=54955 RepID=UPI001CC5B2EB|nr:RING-H2 finger protein ATL40-like [Telopea speciosissima]